MLIEDIISRLKERTIMDVDERGYIKSMNPEDNLIKSITNWNTIKGEISEGQGSELKVEKNDRMKFCALHSSSALCVNNFAMFKQYQKDVSFLQNSNFTEATFEKKITYMYQ